MSKIDELKDLLILAKPDSEERERLKRVITAFFGLRLELIQALKTIKSQEDRARQVLKETAEIDSSSKVTKKERLSAQKKHFKLLNKMHDEATIEADEVIESLLKSQDNLRRLATSGQISSDDLLTAVVPQK
ncbi:MAG: hypothetical protein V3U54_08585 [Thermodesulfobacteriota bacterium]